MIKPTVGRVVWVIRPKETSDIKQPEVGLVTYVHDEGRYINVAGFNHDGHPFRQTSVYLVQDDEPKPEGTFACWMPYQKAVAAGETPAVKHAT